jgi:hypothetical protein
MRDTAQAPSQKHIPHADLLFYFAVTPLPSIASRHTSCLFVIDMISGLNLFDVTYASLVMTPDRNPEKYLAQATYQIYKYGA